jgi:hypothetical protein
MYFHRQQEEDHLVDFEDEVEGRPAGKARSLGDSRRRNVR